MSSVSVTYFNPTATAQATAREKSKIKYNFK